MKLVHYQVLGYNLHMPKYKLFDHTADIGVEIFGRTKKVLFANAASALFDILIQTTDNESKIGKGTKGQKKIMTVAGTDVADLLINFLRELLYLFNGTGFVVIHCIVIDCSNRKLVAQLWVESYHQKKHVMKTEIKAVTYHGLSVERIKNGWKARVIFDV